MSSLTLRQIGESESNYQRRRNRENQKRYRKRHAQTKRPIHQGSIKSNPKPIPAFNGSHVDALIRENSIQSTITNSSKKDSTRNTDSKPILSIGLISLLVVTSYFVLKYHLAERLSEIVNSLNRANDRESQLDSEAQAQFNNLL